MKAESIISMAGTDDGIIDGPWHRFGISPKSSAPPAPVRIALVDDEVSMHRLVRKTLDKFAQDWLLDSYLNARQALRQIPMLPPEVVLMDIRMRGMTGIECARRLRRLAPDLPIVMLSAHVDPEMLLDFMMAGASGSLFKPASATEIIRALKKTLAGGMAFCPRSEETVLECLRMLGKDCNGWELTGREYDILICVCQQKVDKEIAEELGIGMGTVHGHISSILKKLGVHTRAEAIRKILSVNRKKS